MPDKPVVFMLDKPHFQVKLHSDVLEVDLKDGARAELEKLAEARPVLRDSLGWIFQTIIPLDVRLYEIEKVTLEPSGKVNIRIPHRRDVHIPLEPLEAERLVEKMNELIPLEKQRRIERERAEASAETDRVKQELQSIKYRRPGV